MSLGKKNRLYNSQFKINGLIYSQSSGDVSKMRFGLKPMWYNGCGIIAVYNAMLLLHKNTDIRAVASYYEKKGKWLWGLWGTKPTRIKGFLLKNNLKVKKCGCKNADNGVYILLVWNKKGGGMHYMAIEKLETGKIAVYNGYKSSENSDIYDSFEQFFAETRTILIMLMKIY